MIYAQFFHLTATRPLKLIEACGDRGVIVMDGRCTLSHRTWAEDECRKRGYLAWQLMRGERFSDAVPISAVEKIC